jgi:hypothetical protein
MPGTPIRGMEQLSIAELLINMAFADTIAKAGALFQNNRGSLKLVKVFFSH